MGDFNGDPTAKKYVLGLADGLLAHAKPDGSLPDEINWRTEETKGVPAGRTRRPCSCIYGAVALHAATRNT